MEKFYVNEQEEVSGIRTTTYQVEADSLEEAIKKIENKDFLNIDYRSVSIEKSNPNTRTFRIVSAF
jgi:hypothetical protein